MTDYHIAKETEEKRNKFMVDNFSYIEELIKKPGFAQYYKENYRGRDVDDLEKDFIKLHKLIDEGQIKDKVLRDKALMQALCCCLAIEDELKEMITLKLQEVEEGIIEK